MVLILVGYTVLAPTAFRPTSTSASPEIELAVELTAYELCMSEAEPKVCNPIVLTWISSEGSTRVRYIQRVVSALESPPESPERNALQKLPTSAQLLSIRADLESAHRPKLQNRGPTILADSVTTSSVWILMVCFVLLVFFGVTVESWAGSFISAVIFLGASLAGLTAQQQALPMLPTQHLGALWGCLGLVGATFALLAQAQMRILRLQIGRSVSIQSLTWPRGSAFLIAVVLTSTLLLDPRFTALALAPAACALLVGGALGWLVEKALRPGFDATFPWSADRYAEINWNRLTELDLRLVEEALALDPEFVDLRLKFLRSADKLMHQEGHAKNINMMRLKIAAKISSDWSTHLASPKRWEKTISSFKRMNGTFPWKVLVQTAPAEQRPALVDGIRRAGHWVEDIEGNSLEAG
jgi:membrane associated rhomboid family serine protease